MIFAGPIELSQDELTAIFVALAIAAVIWALLAWAATWWGGQVGHALAGHAKPYRHSRLAMAGAWVVAAALPAWLASVVPVQGWGVPIVALAVAACLGAVVGASGSGADGT